MKLALLLAIFHTSPLNKAFVTGEQSEHHGRKNNSTKSLCLLQQKAHISNNKIDHGTVAVEEHLEQVEGRAKDIPEPDDERLLEGPSHFPTTSHIDTTNEEDPRGINEITELLQDGLEGLPEVDDEQTSDGSDHIPTTTDIDKASEEDPRGINEITELVEDGLEGLPESDDQQVLEGSDHFPTKAEIDTANDRDSKSNNETADNGQQEGNDDHTRDRDSTSGDVAESTFDDRAPQHEDTEKLVEFIESENRIQNQQHFEHILQNMLQEESDKENDVGFPSLVEEKRMDIATTNENEGSVVANASVEPQPRIKKYYSWYATGPYRSLMNQNPPCCGWRNKITFYAFPQKGVRGAQEYFAWDAGGPHRGWLQRSPACCGWRNQFSFWAFPTYQPGTRKYYVWYATNPHRGWLATSRACCGWKPHWEFYAYDRKPAKVQLCDEIKSVQGYWQQKYTIAAEHTESWTVGTTNTKSRSEAQTFARELEVGITVGAEVSFKGIGGVNSEVSTTVRNSFSKTFTTEASTSFSEQHTRSVTLPKELKGQTWWVWMFTSTGQCNTKYETRTGDIAYSRSRDDEPCCFPGRCEDLSKGTCNVCTPKYMILKGNSRCKEKGTENGKAQTETLSVSSSSPICRGTFTAVGTNRYIKKLGSHIITIWWGRPWWRCGSGRSLFAVWKSHDGKSTGTTVNYYAHHGRWKHDPRAKVIRSR